MSDRIDSVRALAAMRSLEHTRAEARALFMPARTQVAAGRSSAFPRSRTFRWLLRSQPVGRSLGSALITLALSRLPLGLLISKALFQSR
jgi:hypothetical protein